MYDVYKFFRKWVVIRTRDNPTLSPTKLHFSPLFHSVIHRTKKMWVTGICRREKIGTTKKVTKCLGFIGYFNRNL